MNNEYIKLNILQDILEEKNTLLNTVQNICDNQKTILESLEKTDEILHLFKETTQEKQKSIDKILSLDESFNNTFEQIHHIFQDRNVSLGYKIEIKKMQDKISKIEQLTEKIKNIESANDILVNNLRKVKNNVSKHSLSKMNNIYSKVKKENLD